MRALVERNHSWRLPHPVTCRCAQCDRIPADDQEDEQ